MNETCGASYIYICCIYVSLITDYLDQTETPAFVADFVEIDTRLTSHSEEREGERFTLQHTFQPKGVILSLRESFNHGLQCLRSIKDNLRSVLQHSDSPWADISSVQGLHFAVPMWPSALFLDSSVTWPALFPQSLIVILLVIELHQRKMCCAEYHYSTRTPNRISLLTPCLCCASERCKAYRKEIGWGAQHPPKFCPVGVNSLFAFSWSSQTTIKATKVMSQPWFPWLPVGNAPSSPPPSLPPSHQGNGIEKGLPDRVMCRWSHHRNEDFGLIPAPSCSTQSCCRYNHSQLTLPVVQNRIKQY